jgi:uncharacterized RDD family membrane protein YckC
MQPNLMRVFMPTKARPWPRFFARHFDILFFALLGGVLTSFLAPAFGEWPFTDREVGKFLSSIIITAFWIPVEIVCIATCGKTPGKAMLRLRVADTNGDKPSVRQAISRSFRVWWSGLACGLPFISLLFESAAYRKLTETGSTSWDSVTQLSVSQEDISTTRQVVCGALLAGLLALTIIANMYGS